MKWMMGVALLAVMLLSMAGWVAAEDVQVDVDASASVSADASATAVASGRPLLGKKPLGNRDGPRELVDNDSRKGPRPLDEAVDRVNGTRAGVRGRLTDRRQAFHDRVLEREQDTASRLHEKFGDRLEQVRQQRENRLEAAKQLVADAKERLQQFREKANLTDEEKAEFQARVITHLKAGFDQRIALAEKLEAEGADANVTAEFIAFAQAQKEKFLAATTNQERRDFIVEFNQHWREFKQGVAKGVASHRIELAVAKGQALLELMSGVIDRLETAGFDVSKLDALEDRVDALLDSVLAQETLRQSVHQLKEAHKALQHLKRAIQAVINHELVGEFRAEPVPSPASGDVAVDLTASADAGAETADSDDAAETPSASPEASSTPSASETPTA